MLNEPNCVVTARSTVRKGHYLDPYTLQSLLDHIDSLNRTIELNEEDD